MAKPKIRFNGYTEDWEQRKLGDDLVSIHTGTNLLGSTTNTGIPLIKMGNIQRGYFDTSKVEFLAENEQPDNEDIANYGDFFFNTRNTLELVGKGATWMKNSGEYAFNSNIARFELRNIDTIFFNYLYNTETMTRQIHARAMGTTSVAAIYPRTLESVGYLVPCMKEQQKIGAYFKHLDHLITLHQRKCEQTKTLKKYMLQKMFPQDGEKVPQIRFEGFTEDWEQRKLGEVCQITMGQSPDGSTYSEEPSDYILVQGNADLKDGWVEPRIWTTQKTKTAQAGDLIMSVRAPAGAMGKTAYDVVLGRGVTGIKGNEFVYQLLVKMDSDGYWKKMAAGSTFESINSDVVKKAEILLPQDIEEQNKIGSYFMSLDHLITLHQRKCDELKEVKKFMLQNMFV